MREYITMKISVIALSWLNKNVAEISRVKKEMADKYTGRKDKWCNRWYMNNDLSKWVLCPRKIVTWNKFLVFKFLIQQNERSYEYSCARWDPHSPPLPQQDRRNARNLVSFKFVKRTTEDSQKLVKFLLGVEKGPCCALRIPHVFSRWHCSPLWTSFCPNKNNI